MLMFSIITIRLVRKSAKNKSKLYHQHDSHQNSNGIHHTTRRNNAKLHIETKMTFNCQSKPKKKEQYWKSHHT